jgi:hypothetical protein
VDDVTALQAAAIMAIAARFNAISKGLWMPQRARSWST